MATNCSSSCSGPASGKTHLACMQSLRPGGGAYFQRAVLADRQRSATATFPRNILTKQPVMYAVKRQEFRARKLDNLSQIFDDSFNERAELCLPVGGWWQSAASCRQRCRTLQWRIPLQIDTDTCYREITLRFTQYAAQLAAST